MPCDLTRDWEVFESAPARCVQISFVIVFTSVLTSLKMRRCVLAATVSGLSQQRQRKVGFCSLEATCDVQLPGIPKIDSSGSDSCVDAIKITISNHRCYAPKISAIQLCG